MIRQRFVLLFCITLLYLYNGKTLRIFYFDGEHRCHVYVQIYYIGLRGEFAKVHREAIIISNYEIVANPADHKTKSGFESSAHQIQ